MNLPLQNLVILADLQNTADFYYKSINEAKEFLINLWDELDEDDPFFKRIQNADFEDLKIMLEGCDYTLFKNMNDLMSHMEGESHYEK